MIVQYNGRIFEPSWKLMRQYIPETTNDYIWKKTLLAVTKSSVNARDDYTRKITNGILEDRIPIFQVNDDPEVEIEVENEEDGVGHE